MQRCLDRHAHATHRTKKHDATKRNRQFHTALGGRCSGRQTAWSCCVLVCVCFCVFMTSWLLCVIFWSLVSMDHVCTEHFVVALL